MEIILSFINKILRLIILTLAILPNLSSAQDTGAIQNFSDINLINKKIISNLSIADLVEQVSPSVVNITVSYRPGSPQATGYGSGFIISANKEVVTNFHLVDNVDKIEIELNDGKIYPAIIIGVDEETDLALLQLQSDFTLPYLSLSTNKKNRVGEWVFAIGNPYGMGQSVSLGVISAIGRARKNGGAYIDYIQTDASINKGNSGGPLINLRGEVIGVNSAIYSPTGANIGIAFVIPLRVVIDVIGGIRNDGRMKRGYIGVILKTEEFQVDGESPSYSLRSVYGATIKKIIPKSPSYSFGLKEGDIILDINGSTIRDATQATRAIGALKPDELIDIIIRRRNKTYKVKIMIGERPSKVPWKPLTMSLMIRNLYTFIR